MIKTFIEKAIEGGWKDDELAWFGDYKLNSQFNGLWKANAFNYRYEVIREDGVHDYISISTIPEVTLLDPKAWEAVGKVEGWEAHDHPLTGTSVAPECWGCKMHGLIDALIKGKSAEEYLTEILK